MTFSKGPRVAHGDLERRGWTTEEVVIQDNKQT